MVASPPPALLSTAILQDLYGSSRLKNEEWATRVTVAAGVVAIRGSTGSSDLILRRICSQKKRYPIGSRMVYEETQTAVGIID